jgi:hypothetical protein
MLHESFIHSLFRFPIQASVTNRSSRFVGGRPVTTAHSDPRDYLDRPAPFIPDLARSLSLGQELRTLLLLFTPPVGGQAPWLVHIQPRDHQ